MIIVYIIIAAIAFVFIKALTLEKVSKIERSVLIENTSADVFAYVLLLRNHNYFNKWIMADPALEISYTGVDGTVGFTSSWKSAVKSVGEGQQSIASVLPGKRIDYDLTFIKPFSGTAKVYLTVEAESADSKALSRVTWGFTNDRNFVAKLMQSVFNMEKMLGKDLEISLNNLKHLLEKK